MRTPGATGFAALGAALIAVAYGLGRYAFGLFVPPIRAELGLSPDIVGLVGSLGFVSFVRASLLAPALADRLGARRAAIAASAVGAAGLALISQATGALTLGTGVFACGVCTGLMMPALAAGVQATVRPRLQGRVNAVMNAGTSLGLVICVPAVLLLAGAWRMAYGGFALLAALGLLAAWLLLPSASRVDAGATRSAVRAADPERWRELRRLALFGLATGFVSAAFWIFAPDLVVELGGRAPGTTGLLWLAAGVAGLAGAWASDMGDGLGPGVTLTAAMGAMAVALWGMAAAPGQMAPVLLAAAAFGWATMTLSGLYLVTGVRLLPDRPSLGPVLPFVAITVGQAAGSPAAGWTIARLGYAPAFAIFGALAVGVALCAALYPRGVHGPVAPPPAPGRAGYAST